MWNQWLARIDDNHASDFDGVASRSLLDAVLDLLIQLVNHLDEQALVLV